STATGSIRVAASINAWGSILSQLGGSKVQASSIISNPDTDPHDYEPTPADARLIADARVFVTNGAGYDSWAGRAVRADPGTARQVIDVSALAGTATGGNPHLWYDPAVVTLVAGRLTAALKAADPTDASYFESRLHAFEQVDLAEYHRLIGQIRARYAGTAVGASESIVSPLAQALGLRVLTPDSFLRAISEGSDPSTADKVRIDRQLSDHQIKVYVFNSQNATPDVTDQLKAARRAGIPIATLTETLTPRGQTFQGWQVGQLRALQAALAAAVDH
ncbi:MAG: zinc ABC transporter substrate-binding protein, partial [Jatrophihabitantaceae bacterium]